MKKLLLTTLLFAMTSGAMYASDTLMVRRSVYFDVDASQLGITARSLLDSMAQALRDQGDFYISIYGTTDIDGSERYNQALSERRAHAVQDYLFAKNIKAVKCLTRGLGRMGDRLTKAENRKVDVEVTLTYYSDVAEVFNSLSRNSDQRFTIDPTKPNVITCRNNTRITIPAGTLLLATGDQPKGNVTITVREALGMADYLTQDLSSISDGRMLESRGMLYIDAMSDGQKLDISPDGAVEITIPAYDKASGMKVFYGARNSDKTMNWKVSDKSTFAPPVEKTVPISIDRSMLKKMYITGSQPPAIPKFDDKVMLPVKPTKPRQSLTLKEPQRGTFYTGTAMERTFSKKKIESKDSALYMIAYEKYKASVEKAATYRTKMKAYDAALKEYDKQMQAFQEEGQRRISAAVDYFHHAYEYVAVSSINALIKSAEAEKITNKTVMTNYSPMAGGHPENQHQDLRLILGDVYFRYYHFDEPNAQIEDMNNVSRMDCGKVPAVFRVYGYDGIYDSVRRTTHIADTLAALQSRIIERCAALGLMTRGDISGYVAAVNQLGWINCDRFTDTPPDLLVNMQVKEEGDAKIYMVFSDINSCLPISRYKGNYISSKVPKGKQVRIVAVKVQDGKPQLAISKINTSRRDPVTLQYKTCSLDDIKNSFAAL